MVNCGQSRQGNGHSSLERVGLSLQMWKYFDRSQRLTSQRHNTLMQKLRGRISVARSIHCHRLERNEVAMNADEILAWFKANNPKTLSEINAAGIETKHIGSGGARDVLELVGTPWVSKIRSR